MLAKVREWCVEHAAETPVIKHHSKRVLCYTDKKGDPLKEPKVVTFEKINKKGISS